MLFAIITLLTCISKYNVLAVPGDPVVYFPPFELRAVPGPKPSFASMGNQNHMHLKTFPQQSPQALHHKQIETTPVFNGNFEDITTFNRPDVVEENASNSTVSVHDLLSALGINEENHNIPEELMEQQGRAAGTKATARDYNYPGGYGYPPYSRPPPDYGYPPRGYWPAPSYHDNPYAYLPPTYGHPSEPIAKPLSLLKKLPEKLPDLTSLVKPAATKVATKVSGLIGLVLSLLTGSAADDAELKGIKDLVINGIVKPLMAAKGGIKSLISKLAIPVIVLLLMNLEVLVLIWWLWEDCPEPVHTPPVYPYHYSKPSYSYGGYR